MALLLLIGIGIMILLYPETVVVSPEAKRQTTWEPPKLPEGCEKVYLLVGGNSVGYALKISKSGSFININGFQPVKWRIDSGRYYVDVDIALDKGPVKVRGSNISAQLPARWDMNCNSNALEIVTETGNPIYQVFYRRPDEAVVSGIFVYGRKAVVATDRGMISVPVNLQVAKAIEEFYDGSKSLGLTRIFKYPAWKYPGVFADDNEKR